MLKKVLLLTVLVVSGGALRAETLPKVDRLECVVSNGVVIRTILSATDGSGLRGAIVSSRWGLLTKNFEAGLERGHNGTMLITLNSDNAQYAIAANLDLNKTDLQTVSGNLIDMDSTRISGGLLLGMARCDVQLK